MAFQRATRKQAYLRLMWVAPSGRGKSYGGLWLISELAKRVAGIDSERGSLSLYALPEGAPPSTEEEIRAGKGRWAFDVDELEAKNPQEYLEKIELASGQGYDGLLVDSASHSWMEAQSMVDQMGGWVRAGKVVSPLLAKLQDKFMSYPGHVVVTYRSKTKSVIEPDEKGRNTIRKVGLEPVARGETEFDFTLCFESDEAGMITVTKTRCHHFPLGYTFPRTEIPAVAKTLKAWLAEGELSKLDSVLARIAAAHTTSELAALVPVIQNECSPEEREVIRPKFIAQKTKLAAGGAA